MPIVAAAVVPHSPLLIPSIAKGHTGLFKVTLEKMEQLAQEWYAAAPDCIVVLSPHGPAYDDAIVVHAAEHYRGGFQEFGDLQTQVVATGAIAETHRIKTVAEREHLPLLLQTYDELDYGSSVPLYFFLGPAPDVPIIPIATPHQQPELLLRLAAVLHNHFAAAPTRVAILASADLTRRADRSPGSNRRATIEEKQWSSAIVAVDPGQATVVDTSAATCGYGPILTLLSALNGMTTSGTIMSFEAPLGVGLLTASFRLNP